MNTSDIFKDFKNQKVLVIGDVMVDAYSWGDINRQSPEAPVPVVDVQKKDFRLGGAGNVEQPAIGDWISAQETSGLSNPIDPCGLADAFVLRDAGETATTPELCPSIQSERRGWTFGEFNLSRHDRAAGRRFLRSGAGLRRATDRYDRQDQCHQGNQRSEPLTSTASIEPPCSRWFRQVAGSQVENCHR